MRARYLPFADWLKASGLAVIVYGHVAAATTVRWTPPIYPKQLGVAFFIFATGFTLAREHRSRARVIFNRLFEVLTVGLAVALLMSIVSAFVRSDLNESNYLPLVGLHLIIPDFPANPTTWYIGTYIHLLLFWAFVLRGTRITRKVLVAAVASEVLIRAVLIRTAGGYPAYMAISNWVTVLLLGFAAGQKEPTEEARFAARAIRLAPAMLAWPFAMALVPWRHTFPFMTLNGIADPAATLLLATASSVVYIGFTLAAYGVARRLPEVALIKFFARNTVVVFIVHMPVYYILEHFLRPLVPAYTLRVTVEFLICLPGLALLSEQLRRTVPPAVLRDRIAARFDYFLDREPAVTSTRL
jgi:hypothetical protein